MFLAAGAVIHAVHTNDMFQMGRLRRAMPKTATVFLVGALALAGLPPLSRFISQGGSPGRRLGKQAHRTLHSF